MKNRIVVLALAVLLASCTGDMGPMGPMGQQGIQGVQGEQGIPGQDAQVGYVMFSGTLTQTTIYTDFINTGGVMPSVACYVAAPGSPTWYTNESAGGYDDLCLVQSSGVTWRGVIKVGSAYVSARWQYRIVLFFPRS